MDAKAKKILTNTYWQSGGWRRGSFMLSAEDFEYAKSKGLMFDPLTVSHDELIRRIIHLHEHNVTKERVAAAFLHSLSTRKVHLRSALSSWMLTRHLPSHTFRMRAADIPRYSECFFCDDGMLMSQEEYAGEDLNVLNFERIKWGGVRHNWLVYCWLDLLCLSREEDPFPVREEDVDMLKGMIHGIEACGDKDAARQLEKRWKDVFPSNSHERDQVMEIWGYAGILETKDFYRKERGRGTDFNSVACWRGEDGYSREKLEYFFGPYL